MTSISVQNFKIIMIFVIFIVTLSGVLPLKISCIRKSEAGLSYLNCFSAGMFLTIALIHMLPESVEEYDKWTKKLELEKPFPLPYCCMFIGYIIVLLIDQVIMQKIISHSNVHHKHNKQH